MSAKALSPKDSKGLLEILKKRFENHMHRHEGIDWEDVLAKLEKTKEKLLH